MLQCMARAHGVWASPARIEWYRKGPPAPLKPPKSRPVRAEHFWSAECTVRAPNSNGQEFDFLLEHTKNFEFWCHVGLAHLVFVECVRCS